jgi:hypothetical protein
MKGLSELQNRVEVTGKTIYPELWCSNNGAKRHFQTVLKPELRTSDNYTQGPTKGLLF